MIVRTAQDADAIREDIETVYDGWYGDGGRIDWTDFLDRLENRGHDLGDDLLSGGILRIKEIVREIRKADH